MTDAGSNRSAAGLIRSAADGDADALEQLIRDLAPSVYAYLAGMLGDDREAEEGMQETFVRVARAVGRYDAETDAGDAEGWVFAIARHVAADLRPTPASPPGEFPPPAGGEAEWARRALRALPIELREVLVCEEILRWDTARIAATLGVDTDEVANRILGARTQIAEDIRAFQR
jgi:DNA-directed RNA polymerase specialized sigma24 family protein